MAVNAKISFNLNGLEKLAKNTKTHKVVKVGILGNKNARTDNNGLTNSEVGAMHEFGSYTNNIPRRSFIKDPLVEKIEVIHKQVAKLAKENLDKQNGLDLALVKIGIVAENIIQEAFETGGFGKWKPLIEATIKEKKSDAILIDTAELRKSITSRVDNK